MSEPITPLDLLTDPAALPRVLTESVALSRLALVITADGESTHCPLRLSPGGALLTGALSTTGALDVETIVWRNRARSAGGTIPAAAVRLADALIRAIKAETFNTKILYLLPFLGANLAAARMPLRDSLNVGIATNSGFTESDYTQSTGLQCGTGRYLNTGLLASSLNATDQRGGMGAWELNATRSALRNDVVGSANGPRTGDPTVNFFGLQLHSTFSIIYWGDSAGSRWAIESPATIGGFFYGQRSATNLLTLYRDGSSVATNTDTYTPTGLNSREIWIGTFNNSDGPDYTDARLGLVLLTDGTLTGTEAADLHTLLQDYLITPTGR